MRINYTFAVLLVLLTSQPLAATGITFTFENGRITGSDPYYYEFDIEVYAIAPGTRLGDCQVYVNYNTEAFGENIFTNGNISVTKGSITQGELAPSVPLYGDGGGGGSPILTDNSPSRFALTISYNFPGVPSNGNELPVTPSQWAHVKCRIADRNSTSALAFEQTLMSGQQYESDNSTKYSPVTASDSEDQSLPVILTSVSARRLSNGHIEVAWETASESGITGYNIFRGSDAGIEKDKVNACLIPRKGTGSHGAEYLFIDCSPPNKSVCWYTVSAVNDDGTATCCGTVSAENMRSERGSFRLYQNFPNPFNPETRITYSLGERAEINISIFDIMGRRIKTLVKGVKNAGEFRVMWNGTDEQGMEAGSGVYVVGMKAGEYMDALKIIKTE